MDKLEQQERVEKKEECRKLVSAGCLGESVQNCGLQHY
jgi:hypothetical protein